MSIRPVIKRSLKISRNINPQPIVRATHENLKTVWRIAARDFFREAARLVAVDTGMSGASLIPLAKKVQIASEVKAAIDSRLKGSGRKKGYYSIDGSWNSDGIRSRTQGEREAASRIGKSLIIDFGTPETPLFIFRFEIVIHQWSIKEPIWNVLAPAREAFLSTYRKELRKRIRSADIIKYMLTGRVTIRGAE